MALLPRSILTHHQHNSERNPILVLCRTCAGSAVANVLSSVSVPANWVLDWRKQQRLHMGATVPIGCASQVLEALSQVSIAEAFQRRARSVMEQCSGQGHVTAIGPNPKSAPGPDSGRCCTY